MDSYELNKVLGALLGTCLALLSLNIAASAVFNPKAPKKPGYEIAVPEKAPAAPGPAEPEVPIATLLASADLSRGEQASKQCLACHSFEKGGPNKVGPDLWSIVGRPKALHAGYSYSAAMKAKGGTWTIDDLNTYLKNPRADVPGTLMNFGGIPSAKTRADLIAWLNTRSDNPQPLPKAAEAPAPAAAAQPPAAPPPAAPPPAAAPPAEAPAAAPPPAAPPPAAAPPAAEQPPAAPTPPGEPKQ
jgi:cytochrome c